MQGESNQGVKRQNPNNIKNERRLGRDLGEFRIEGFLKEIA